MIPPQRAKPRRGFALAVACAALALALHAPARAAQGVIELDTPAPTQPPPPSGPSGQPQGPASAAGAPQSTTPTPPPPPHFEPDPSLGAPSTTNGWTDLAPSVDSLLVYVSSSRGDDAFDGLSESSPKRTIAAGKALLRQGKPDWLLLQRGDSWQESLGQWMRCGRSAAEPVVVTSFGDSTRRPMLLTGTQDGVLGLASGPSPDVLRDVAFVGIHFRAHTYDGTNGAPSGLNWLIECDGLLVEDCLFERYQINVSIPAFGGRKHDIRLRRNVILDAFALSGTVGHGIYLSACDGVLVEENVLDRNGWNESIPGAEPSLFRHGIYVQGGAGACTGVVVRGNLVCESASHGLQLRSGGIADDNLFVRNPIALQLGGGNEPVPGGVRGVARGNVILDGHDINDQHHRGWGIDAANLSSGEITDNVIAQLSEAHSPIAMNLYGNQNGIGVHATLVARNVVWDWGGAISVHGGGAQITGVSLIDNVLADTLAADVLVAHHDESSTAGVHAARNRCFSTRAPDTWMSTGTTMRSLADWKRLVSDNSSTTLAPNVFPAPERTLGRYATFLGIPQGHPGFLREARKQSRLTWREELTARAASNWIRAGFGLPPR